MAEDSVPSTSDQWSSKEDELIPSRKRVTRPKNSNKQQNAIDAQTETPDTSRKKQPSRKSSGEKLEKLEQKSRFSCVPEKLKPQTCERVDVKRQKQCSSETDQPSSSYTQQDESSGVCSSHKSQSCFDIKFTHRPSDSLEIGSGVVKTHQSALYTSSNILHYTSNVSQGLSYNLKQAKKWLVVRHVAEMDTFTSFEFARKVSAFAFHPKFPTILAAASRNGEILLWDTEESFRKLSIPSILTEHELGHWGSVQDMKFHHEKKTIIYTASQTGGVMQQDFLGEDNITFFNRIEHKFIWFSSLDTSVPYKLVLASNTLGFIYLANFDGQKVWQFAKRVHDNEVTHVEFSTRDPYIFVTASMDHTVKIWDLRMFSDGQDLPESICCLDHNEGVKSAYFNPSTGTSLLTTGKYKELRVYTSPLWHLETVIEPPFHNYSHMTPVKAQWHPLEDLIVVGRYNENYGRYDMSEQYMHSIDIYDAHTGKREHYLNTMSVSSLNAFNSTGDILASSGRYMGIYRKKRVKVQ